MIKRFLRDETGLELSEYAVAAALIALAVITAFSTLGTNIGTKITSLANSVNGLGPTRPTRKKLARFALRQPSAPPSFDF